MKLIALILVSFALFVSPVHAQLIGDVDVAFFANGSIPSAEIASWFEKESYGMAHLKFTQFSPISLDSYCNYILAKSTVNAHPGFFTYIFYDPSGGCNGGVAWHGGTPWTDTQYPGVVLVNTLSQYTIEHEFSHSMGLLHPTTLYCPYGELDIRCYYLTSGSVMTNFGPITKELLGWIEVPEIVTDGEYTIYTMDGTAGVRGYKLAIIHPWTGEWTYLYFSYHMNYLKMEFLDYVKGLTAKFGTLSITLPHCFDGVMVERVPADGTTAKIKVTYGCTEPMPPVCEPEPTQQRMLSCPPGYKGAIIQERISTCPGPTWGPWTTISSTCRKRGNKGEN